MRGGWSYDVSGGVDAGACAAPLKFPYPSEVDDFKGRLRPLWDATDVSVDRCAKLPPEQKAAWKAAYAAWQALGNRQTPLFGAYGEWVSVCAQAKTLDAWRKTIEDAGCGVVGPRDIQGYDVSPVLAVAVPIVLLAGIAAIIVFAPEIKALLPHGRGTP